jgi:hypothetical protein
MHAVDRYVQGEMDAVEASGFEAKMAGDPLLAADVAAQRKLGSVLRLSFTPSPIPVLPPAPNQPPSGGWRITPPLVAGTMVVAAAAAAVIWVAVVSLSPSGARTSDAASAYQHAFEGREKFKPQSTVDLEVAISTKIGHNVQFGDSGDVKFGSMTGATGSPMALGIPAMSGDDQLLIVIDLAPANAPGSGTLQTTQLDAHLFRHALVRNGLSLVEVSPRKTPSVIHKLRVGA